MGWNSKISSQQLSKAKTDLFNTNPTFSKQHVSTFRIFDAFFACQEAHMAGSTMASPFYLGAEASKLPFC